MNFPASEIECVDLPQSNSKSARALYPHAQLFLVPSTLIELIGRKNIVFPDGRSRPVSDFLRVKPGELAIDDLDTVCRQICDLVQTVLYSRKSAAKMAEILIDVPESIRLCDLTLSARARVAFQSRAFFQPHGPWRHCTLRELIATHALGARLLLAFLLAVESEIENQQKILRKPPEQNQINQQDQEIRSESGNQPTHLEDDLKILVDNVLYSQRSADVFLTSNGWDGGGERLLAEISTRYVVSKERARQVLFASQSAMQKHFVEFDRLHYFSSISGKSSLTRLRSAISLLESQSPVCAQRAKNLLKESEISRNEFHPYGVLNAAMMFGMKTPLNLRKVGRITMVCTAQEGAHLEALQSLGRSMARSLGLVSEQWVWARALESSPLIRLDHVRLALQSDEKLVRLIEDSSGNQWFWTNRCANPHGAVMRPLKLIAFLGACGLSTMLNDINSDIGATDLQTPGKLPAEVLCALLGKWGMIEIKPGIWSASDAESFYVCQTALSAVERQIAQIVELAGGTMDRALFQKTAYEQSINSHTLHSYVRRSPLFSHSGNKADAIVLAK